MVFDPCSLIAEDLPVPGAESGGPAVGEVDAASDACRLQTDGLVDDSAGWPCLRFFNSKVKTEQLVPLSVKAASAIKTQQQHVREHWPAGTRWLFPRVQSNPDGALPFSYATLHHRLYRWQTDIDLRDEAGNPIRVSAHRFRHTLVICTASKPVRDVCSAV